MPHRQRRHRRLRALKQRDRQLVGDGLQGHTNVIKPLTQRHRRGHGAQPQSAAEETILAVIFNRLEVTFAERQQADIGTHHVAIGNAATDRQLRIDGGGQLGEVIEAVTDRRQTGVAGHVARGLDDFKAHRRTQWVKWRCV